MIAAVFRRDWAIERTYDLRLLLNFTDTAGVAAGLYFISLLVEDPPALAGFSGSYFDFVIVGLAVTSFAGVGLSGFGESLVREQSTGTIELLLASPASPLRLMTGMFAFPFVLAAVQFAALVAVGIGLIGSGIPLGGLALSVPVLVLSTICFAAVGIASAGVLVIAKRGDPISSIYFQLSLLFSGAIFPLSILPSALEAVSVVFPARWSVQATRELWLADAGWRDVMPETLVLAGFCVVTVPLAVVFFRRCLGLARREGVLGTY